MAWPSPESRQCALWPQSALCLGQSGISASLISRQDCDCHMAARLWSYVLFSCDCHSDCRQDRNYLCLHSFLHSWLTAARLHFRPAPSISVAASAPEWLYHYGHSLAYLFPAVHSTDTLTWQWRERHSVTIWTRQRQSSTTFLDNKCTHVASYMTRGQVCKLLSRKVLTRFNLSIYQVSSLLQSVG